MTKKPLNPLEDPPVASSSEEEEVDTSSGEAEEDEEQKSDASSSEEDEPMNPVNIPSGKNIETPSAAVTIAVPGITTETTAAEQGSDSDSGTESQAGSDSETEPDAGAGKAIAVTAEKPKKKEGSNLPAVKSAKKRPSEENSTDVNAKRAKKVSGNDENKIGEDTKKLYFQRLWTEEDEISLLQGMIDFKTDTGNSPYLNMNGFYEFAKKSISFEVSKNQFVEKIRGLKKKYLDKGNKSFSKPHDKKCLELAKYIWGTDGMALETVIKSNVKPKKSEKLKSLEPNGEEEVILGVKSYDWFENSGLVRSIVSFGVDEYYVKQRWSMLSMETKKKIEKKWLLLQEKEFELVVQKTEILKEVVSMIQKQPLE